MFFFFFINCTRPDVCWEVDSCMFHYKYIQYDWFLTHFLHCLAVTWLKTTCHLERKGTTLILFGINYISYYPQMDNAVISSGSCLGGGNIEDPQM